MQLPTIHLNGTSKDELIAVLCNASAAIDAAYAALKLAAPNGRDYYPQGPEAFDRARREHESRLAGLDKVKREVDELTIAIDEGGYRT
jgi:hypothetical protein